MPRNLLLISSSRVHGFGFLENVATTLQAFLKKFAVQEVLFVPYANTDYPSYLRTVQQAFEKLAIGCTVRGVHEGTDAVAEVKAAQAIFIGGGNTFLLLKKLYDKKLVDVIRQRVLVDGIPYIGSSAGTNVATVSINTTNDMPIVYPPSFNALGLIPFNINPHYLDPLPDSKHQGETRAERINQYHEMAECYPVLGLREGSSMLVDGESAKLIGEKNAILFTKGTESKELPPESDLSFLLRNDS